jgi:hypothetical protein
MTAITGGIWLVFTYLEDQRNRSEGQKIEVQRRSADQNQQILIRQFEARRPFLEIQLKLNQEIAAVVGRLVTIDRNKPEWNEDSIRFWQLYWSELSVVEDETVKAAMQDFGNDLEGFTGRPETITQGALKQSSYRLAQAIRTSIEKSWRVGP